MTGAERYASVGFLYHPPSGKVLLHHRDAKASHYPLCWAGFGGMDEPADGGDPRATFLREMREELGITLHTGQVAYLRSYVNRDVGRQRHVYYAAWPSMDDRFALAEGDGYRWYTLDEALALPDLMAYAREDLLYFRARILAGGPPLSQPLG